MKTVIVPVQCQCLSRHQTDHKGARNQLRHHAVSVQYPNLTQSLLVLLTSVKPIVSGAPIGSIATSSVLVSLHYDSRQLQLIINYFEQFKNINLGKNNERWHATRSIHAFAHLNVLLYRVPLKLSGSQTSPRSHDTQLPMSLLSFEVITRNMNN